MKKPTLQKFKELSERHGGNQTKIAEEMGVDRLTVRSWCRNDPEFDDVIKNQRAKSFDEIYKSAVQLAKGIPKRNRKGEIIGWKSYPEPTIVKYLLSTLGKEEGFGESVDITSGGAPIIPTKITSRKKAKEHFENLEKDY